MIKRITILLVVGLLAASCTDTSSDEPTPENLASTLTAAATATSLNTEVITTDSRITQIATLKKEVGEVNVYDVPDKSSQVTHTFTSERRPVGAEALVPTVFTVVANPNTPVGWINVNLPVKPNGTSGWILAETATVVSTGYRIEIDRDNFNLKVIDFDKVIVDTEVAIGTGQAATPKGSFFITELLESTNPFYGPYAYGLSGFSEQLNDFQGEDAIIGIHGTNDPSSIGTAASSGCVRLPNETISSLVELLPLGTPVEIT